MTTTMQFGDDQYKAIVDAALAPLGDDEKQAGSRLMDVLSELADLGRHVKLVDPQANRIDVTPVTVPGAVKDLCHPPPPPNLSIHSAINALLQWHAGVMSGQPTAIALSVDVMRCVATR